MNYKSILFFTIITSLFIGCKSEKEKKKRIQWSVSANTQKVYQKDNISFNIHTNETQFDSIVVSTPNKKKDILLNEKKYNWINPNDKVGLKDFIFEAYLKGRKYTYKKSVYIFAKQTPTFLKHTVLEKFPHDPKSFTQGLEFDDNNFLYEGTGQLGESKLLKTVLKTGNAVQELSLDNSKFGEGITILNNKIYQLTWQNGFGYIYDKETFKLLSTFPYGKSQEGWGLCNNGNFIYKSDGTNKIYKLDPVTLKELDYIEVMTNTGEVTFLNELEWIDGKIYANVYLKDYIVVINPNTGVVENLLQFPELVKEQSETNENVLNGIAYNKEKNIIYVTGKNWDSVFKVKIEQK